MNRKKNSMEKYVYNVSVIKHNNFISRFNGNTGVYIRSDVFEQPGKDPFMAEYPELIDIGIMEKCICSSKCKVDCYQKACDRTGSNMSFDNYKKIIDESKGKVFQVALGGAGDPDTHENFADILKYTAESNIVPNFTTSGIALTKEKAELCYRYCGAVAVSEHFEDYTDKAVELLIQSKVKTNIHFVLNTETIDKAIEILGTNKYRKGINAIIFLLYKPVGLGKQEKILKYSNPKVREFFELVNKHEYDFKIGFDSCSCTALLNFSNNIDFEMIDYCEGGRYSMYISADMKAYPCSFANQHPELGFNISNDTIQNAWSSFNYFRNKLTQRCLACNDRCFCGGGCPLLSSIILCNRKERSAERGIIE